MAASSIVTLDHLSPTERKFVAEYLVDFSGVAALMRLGYTPQSAARHSVAYLRRPRVREVIERSMRRIETHGVISATRVLEEVVRIATADARRAIKEDGTLVPVQDLDEDTARAVASIKVTRREARGSEPAVVTQELKFWNKNQATDTLLKILGKFSDATQITNNTTLNAGPGALDSARLHALENKLREVLGQPAIEEAEARARAAIEEQDRKAEAAAAALQAELEGVGEVIEAADPPDMVSEAPDADDACFL